MGEKFTSRVGYLIRNFRIASDMTQKELADKCGLNESTIRNYELGNRYPDEATLLNIANNLGVSFYALSDPDVANIFSALHVLFDIEWAYGLRPTMKDGEVCFKFEERLPSAGPRPQEDLDSFRKMVEYWARLRDKLEDEEISETEYYLKEVKYPMNPTAPNKEYTVLFDIEWAYGLRPTMKDGEVCFKFEERLPSAGPRPQEDLDSFRKMVEYWARLRDKLEDEEISETEYYLKEVKYPMNPTAPNKEYTVSLNLDDDDQLLVQNMNEDNDTEETAELLKDLFPDFSYVKRKRKPKKE